MEPLPLYSGVKVPILKDIFTGVQRDVRKVIVATNVAETSVTVPNIVFVVDCGFVKTRVYDAKVSRAEYLLVTPISKQMAIQRSGRAGRVAPGECIRLYTQDFFNKQMIPSFPPELHRCELSSVILELFHMGVQDIASYPWLARPPLSHIAHALEKLYAMQAIDAVGVITDVGKKMAEFPLEPNLAKLVVSGIDYKCVDQMIELAAMLSVGDPFVAIQDKAIFKKQRLDDDDEAPDFEGSSPVEASRRMFSVIQGDHITLMNVITSYSDPEHRRHSDWTSTHGISIKVMESALAIRDQLRNICKKCNIELSRSSAYDLNVFLKCISSAFFFNAAVYAGGKYRNVLTGDELAVHPSSVLALLPALPPCVVYSSVETGEEHRFLRHASVIPISLLREVAPHVFGFEDVSGKAMRAEDWERLKAYDQAP